jgi:hypothetical protein
VENPENRELVEAWVQAVFPLILDVETKEWKLAMPESCFSVLGIRIQSRHVFGPPGSRSISHRYGSGSNSQGYGSAYTAAFYTFFWLLLIVERYIFYLVIRTYGMAIKVNGKL